MTYAQRYNKFRKSRIDYWQPRIATALQGVADSILQQPTIEAAIQAAHNIPPIQDMAAIIKSLYIDAGRIMGAYAYQEVMKQAKGKKKKSVAEVVNEVKASPYAKEIFEITKTLNSFLDKQDTAQEQKRLMPMGYNEQLINDIIQYYQTNLLTEAVIPITQNLRDYILAKLIEAQQQGLSITDAVDAIEGAGMVRKRAFLIARTETVKAANYGAKKGAQATGYPMNKVWVSGQDNRTRRLPRNTADHLHMNGVEAAMDEPFNVQDETGLIAMDRPGDSGAPIRQLANCRCCISFRVL